MNIYQEKKQEMMQQLGQDALFGALIIVLQEDGLDGMTMQKVAIKAGMAISTLYKYFKSKEELLNYAMQRLFDRYQEATEKIAPEMLPDEKLRDYTRRSLEFCLAHTGIFVTLERARLAGMLDKQQDCCHKDRTLGQVKQIIQAGIEAGIFRPVEAELAGVLYLSLLMGYFHVQIDYRVTDLEKMTAAIHDLMLRYLRPD